MFYPFSIVFTILYDIPCRQLAFYEVTLLVVDVALEDLLGSFEVIGEFRWEALGLASRIKSLWRLS
jgi:hypothetical protein